MRESSKDNLEPKDAVSGSPDSGVAKEGFDHKLWWVSWKNNLGTFQKKGGEGGGNLIPFSSSSGTETGPCCNIESQLLYSSFGRSFSPIDLSGYLQQKNNSSGFYTKRLKGFGTLTWLFSVNACILGKGTYVVKTPFLKNDGQSALCQFPLLCGGQAPFKGQIWGLAQKMLSYGPWACHCPQREKPGHMLNAGTYTYARQLIAWTICSLWLWRQSWELSDHSGLRVREWGW